MTLENEDFILDDLLVNCCKQIINNEGNIDNIERVKYPDSIIDWVSGKVLRCLPNLFLKRLLSLILENKDLKSLLKYHQSHDGTKFIFEVYHNEVHKTVVNRNAAGLYRTNKKAREDMQQSITNPSLYLAQQESGTSSKRHVLEVAEVENTNAPAEWFS